MFKHIQHTEIPRTETLSAECFIEQYRDPQLPVVMTKLSADWKATREWNLDYISNVAGENIVPVYSSQPAAGKDHQHQATIKLRLADYFKMLQHDERDLRMFFYNILRYAPKLLDDFSYPKIGLKLFKRLPVLFVGGRGAKVQMHYDIDLANLLLCHFGGTKHVLLIPPEQTKYVYKVPYSFSALHAVDLTKPDFERFPALRKINAWVAVLQHGDVLYIPSGYWHYIVYEDIGFSMTLRSIPTSFSKSLTLMKNIFITRTIEGLMRKLFGQKWNDRNERLAVERTNLNLQREEARNIAQQSN